MGNGENPGRPIFSRDGDSRWRRVSYALDELGLGLQNLLV